jgi:hypothetical protein
MFTTYPSVQLRRNQRIDSGEKPHGLVTVRIIRLSIDLNRM